MERNYVENIETPEELEEIIRNHRLFKDFFMFVASYVNPAVTDAKHWAHLVVTEEYMEMIDYSRLRFYRTKNPELNAARTAALLEVLKDIARLPAVRELWMGDRMDGFLGEPAFLYRPRKLYDRVQVTAETLKTKEEVLSLVKRFEEHVPREWVLGYLRRRLGEEAVEELDEKKIVVKFYDGTITKEKVRGWHIIQAFTKDVDAYLAERGLKLM
ncbi:MAG: hypothetical protein HSCHL_1750 [Hydrogenibacillus schlegelii]|uniref:Uncharacterized protein n=1 Tax=Hydrogenibacillus schlegelii TaxID=1484 RepID=A0A2T5GBK3_HYDSH|nr:MAG: hypothetical protein HSCHL_1750 [Hydrogenibacillus schlegelii]